MHIFLRFILQVPKKAVPLHRFSAKYDASWKANASIAQLVEH